jgi:hypothetical protein
MYKLHTGRGPRPKFSFKIAEIALPAFGAAARPDRRSLYRFKAMLYNQFINSAADWQKRFTPSARAPAIACGAGAECARLPRAASRSKTDVRRGVSQRTKSQCNIERSHRERLTGIGARKRFPALIPARSY